MSNRPFFDSPVRAHTVRRHRLPFGAELQSDNGVLFRFWAPQCRKVRICLESPDGGTSIRTMRAGSGGWHTLLDAGARPGTRYQYVLPDDLRVPDPASRFQPQDVHGPSEVIDPTAYQWRDGSWVTRPWHEAVIYELHVGTFTEAGTFRAALERLEHLVMLGVTAIQLMPIADFPGARNWGYDGVLLYAPDSTYGRPEDVKAFVDAAHARGIMVLLDVIYNHFGPDGNYLPRYAPEFFTDRHRTPWGAAFNYDGSNAKPVRDFVIHNALYWIEEYHLDGLRFDAIHAIVDEGPKHVLEELAERVRACRQWPVHLLLENEDNEVHWLSRDSPKLPAHYTAQWNDDIHHVLHVAVTGEGEGNYADYLDKTDFLARALAEGFAFQGEIMPFRGAARGEPSAALPPLAFVAFIQNHDQIGNRGFGERLSLIAPSEAIRAIAAVYLLLPQIPMMFMGEEWGSVRPFPFFCEFAGDLAEAVRRGRREEFAKFPAFKDELLRARIPDPQAASTFASAKLDWAEAKEPDHAAWLSFYRGLLRLRRERIWPILPRLEAHAGRYQVLGRGAVMITWQIRHGAPLVLEANLSGTPTTGFSADTGEVLLEVGDVAGGEFGPWSVRWSIRAEAVP
jgi:malto-oligosyltrehalose trehalohydrolase